MTARESANEVLRIADECALPPDVRAMQDMSTAPSGSRIAA